MERRLAVSQSQSADAAMCAPASSHARFNNLLDAVIAAVSFFIIIVPALLNRIDMVFVLLPLLAIGWEGTGMRQKAILRHRPTTA
jgi:hypothetical protein